MEIRTNKDCKVWSYKKIKAKHTENLFGKNIGVC